MALNEFTRTCPQCGAIRYITMKGIFMEAKLESPIRICPECESKVMLLTSKEWCQRGYFSKLLALIPWWCYLAAGAAGLLVGWPVLGAAALGSGNHILLTLAVMVPVLLTVALVRMNSAKFLEQYAKSVLRCRKKEYRNSLASAGKVRSDSLPLPLFPGPRKKLEQLLKTTRIEQYNSGSLFEL